MPQSSLSGNGNLLLSALSPADLALLQPGLQRIPLAPLMELAHPDTPVSHVYFPEGGIISMVSDSAHGKPTEVGIFGREGCSGTALLLGAGQSPHRTYVQVDGSTALRIEAERLLDAVARSPSLQQLLLRFVQTLMVQIGQSTVSNAHQQIEARLARWLLMSHDRVDGDEILLTHDFMATMVSAQRSGVTLALHVLEGLGTIRSVRGKVIIRDRARLEELAGPTYGMAEAEYRRLIGPFGRSA